MNLRSLVVMFWLGLLVGPSACARPTAPTQQMLPSPTFVEHAPDSDVNESRRSDEQVGDLEGWWLAERCTYGLKSDDAGRFFRVTNDELVMANDLGLAARRAWSFERFDLDGRHGLTGLMTTGRARWLIDGYVMVDTPFTPPSARCTDGCEDLAVLHQRFSIQELPFSQNRRALVTLLSVERPTPPLHCLVIHRPPDLSESLEREVEAALAHERCEQATACCVSAHQAYETQSILGENEEDLCRGDPRLSPVYCSGWVERAYGYMLAEHGTVPSTCRVARDLQLTQRARKRLGISAPHDSHRP